MDKKSNKKIIVKLICVILSFSLWLYINNVENPTKDTVIRNVPVELQNIESLQNKDMSILNPDSYKVELNVSGPSNQVYSLSSDDFKIKVDLSEYALKIGENSIPVEVVDYPEGINIKNNNSLVVKVNIEQRVQKELPVESKVQLNYQNGFSVKTQNISPSKINISGAESIINSVEKAAIVGKVDNVSRSFEETYDIVLYDKNNNKIIGAEMSDTKAVLSVEIVQGKQVSVKPSIKGNLKEGLTLVGTKLSFDKITISGDSATVEKIDSISTNDIDISSLNSSQSIDVELKIPKGIYVESMATSVTVSFEIKDTSLMNKTIKDVNINYSSKNDSLFNYDMPKTCDIVLSGSKDQVEAIKPSDINVTASLKDLELEGTYKVKWSAKLDNNDISIVNDSGEVSVTLSKK